MSNFKEQLKKRAIKHGMLFLERNANIRSVASKAGISKSTVHLDLYRLEEFHLELFKKVKEKLEYHNKIKHLRGGVSTQKKYLSKKEGNKK